MREPRAKSQHGVGKRKRGLNPSAVPAGTRKDDT